MEAFIYHFPTKVYFGSGAAANALPDELGKLGKTVMLAYGGGSIKANGIYDEMMNLLSAAGKTVVEFPGIMSNPTYAKVQQGAAFAKEHHVDFILAVGGGSVIDCCKVIAAQAMTEEDIWEMEFTNHRFPTRMLPLGAVVTVFGTGAEMNGGAVITNEAQKLKAGVFAAAPNFAVLDPPYTASVPIGQVISGAFDTLSHAMETYFGLSDGNNVSDSLAEAVMQNTITNLSTLLKNSCDSTARSNLAWDSAMAENGILKLGRKTDFVVHQIEHQLGAYTNCNHGQGLAVLHPTYYRHIYKNDVSKFARFAVNVWNILSQGHTEEELAQLGIYALERFICACGLPTRLSQLKGCENLTSGVLHEIAFSCNLVKTGCRELTHEEVLQILTECL